MSVNLKPDELLEMCVVGELYLDTENKFFGSVCADDFLESLPRALFKVLEKYPDLRDDSVLLIDKAKTENIPAGLTNGILAAMDAALSTTLLPEHIKQLREKTQRRKILQLAANKEMLSSDDVKILHDLTRPKTTGRFIVDDLSNMALQFTDEIDRRREAFSGGYQFPTGYERLDHITGGLQRHNIFVVGGRTSLGKTTFMINVALNLLKLRDVRVMYFTCEMEPLELMDRIVSRETGIENYKIRYGKLSRDESMIIHKLFSSNEFFKRKLKIYFSSGLDVAMIRDAVDKHRPQVIIVDHVQLLRTAGRNRAQEIEYAMYELKGIANDYDIAIMAGSQISRESVKVHSKDQLSNVYFKGSGGIEEAATVTSELRLSKNERKEYTTWLIDLDISKNRFGGIGSIGFSFDRATMTFVEKEHLS